MITKTNLITALRPGATYSILLFSLFLWACATQIKPVQNKPVLFDAGLSDVHTLDLYSTEDSIHSLVSGIDKQTGATVVKYLASGDAGQSWTSPVIVNQGQAEIKASKRGNDFQLAVSASSILAAWKTVGADPWVGVLSFAISHDGGNSWEKVASPLGEELSAFDQGYFDLGADGDDNFHLSWLDDREEAGDTQGLRYARYSTENGWHFVTNLEQTVCTCCWSKIVNDDQRNVHVLFRDDSPRDMRLISSFSQGKSWSPAKTIIPFNWEFIGCPHQGGALTNATLQDKAHLLALVWNGDSEKKGLYFSRTHADEQNGSSATQVAGKTSKSGDLAVINERIGMVYSEGLAEDKKVVFKQSINGGEHWSEGTVLTAPGVGPSHPRIVTTGEGFRVFWTEWLDSGEAVAKMSALL